MAVLQDLRVIGRVAAAAVALFVSLAGEDVRAASATRTFAFQYHAVTGLLTREIVEPSQSAFRVETSYEHDAFGNRKKVTIAGTGITARFSTAEYDGSGRFAIRTRNAMNHATTRAFDARFGVVATETDPNGIVAQAQYDGLGRLKLEIARDGTRTSYDYAFCQGILGGIQECPAQARYVVTTTPLATDGVTAIGTWVKVYHDALDREVRQESQGFDGRKVRIDTEYDALGRIARQSEPYFSGERIYWTAATYDLLDRPQVTTAPNGGRTTAAYTGLTTTVTNAKGQSQVVIRNSQGQTVSSRDALGSLLRFEYDPFGNLIQTIDPAGNRIRAGFDIRGRRITLNDPDLGLRRYSYDVLGQLVSTLDAKNQTATYTYDLLGRLLRRTETGLTSTWTYDTAAKGIGRPATAASSTGVSRSFSYDSLGRPSGMAETRPGGLSVVTSTSYDLHGRASGEVLPGGQPVTYVYTALGYLQEVRNGVTGGLIWRAEAMDAAGNVTQELYGNNIVTMRTIDPAQGVVTGIRSRKSTFMPTSDDIQNLGYAYDVLANLTNRTDQVQGTQEAFGYDALNRLTASQVSGFNAQTVSYDLLGNIASKSDVGTYAYGPAGGERPHAVLRIAGLSLNTGGTGGTGGTTTTNVVEALLTTVGNLLRVLTGTYKPPAPAATVDVEAFSYDANGNLLSGGGRVLTWTSFDMPATIARGAVTSSFSYGPGHERIAQVKAGQTIHYFASSELVEDAAAGTATWLNYIAVDGRLVAQLSRAGTAPANTAAARYFHTDHLGSIDMVTDEFGGVVERLDFDAWGRRRQGTGAPDTASGTITSTVRRGYTGHEQLDAVGLVHMNGRVYDPLVARFLSADPIVQAPLYLQGYNRYSYALNNPLSYTDPSGFMTSGPGKTDKGGARVETSIGAQHNGGREADLNKGGGKATAVSGSSAGPVEALQTVFVSAFEDDYRHNLPDRTIFATRGGGGSGLGAYGFDRIIDNAAGLPAFLDRPTITSWVNFTGFTLVIIGRGFADPAALSGLPENEKFSLVDDVLSAALNALSQDPVFGTQFDVASALVDLYVGNYVDAGLTLGVAVLSASPYGRGVKGILGVARGFGRVATDVGNVVRVGRQARLRELANDNKLGSADRGWIKQEMNSIARGQRSTIRNPPGKDLAHGRGREAAKGYDYSHANLQDRSLHRLQHKYDDFGRANAERPLR